MPDSTNLPPSRSFQIRLTSSRIDKGFIALPKRACRWFPDTEQRIRTVFDDAAQVRLKAFRPPGSKSKEGRIFGLGAWMGKGAVRAGDTVTISVDDPKPGVYRIALDRYVRDVQIRTTQARLRQAATEAESERELTQLARLVRRRPRTVALAELGRVAGEDVRAARPKVRSSGGVRRETVPVYLRTLLGVAHRGRCQLCGFTFAKRDGEPYFEVHHLDRDRGHHPKNLLLVCANCHVQLEEALVEDMRHRNGWLVSLRISGKRVSVDQPLARGGEPLPQLAMMLAIAFAQCGYLLIPSSR